MRLSDLKPGQTGVITKILGHGAFRKRVMEIGFVKGREVSVILNAPLQDPVKYALMGYEVSLRRAEAELVEVQLLEEWVNSKILTDAHTEIHHKSFSGLRTRLFCPYRGQICSCCAPDG